VIYLFAPEAELPSLSFFYERPLALHHPSVAAVSADKISLSGKLSRHAITYHAPYFQHLCDLRNVVAQ